MSYEALEELFMQSHKKLMALLKDRIKPTTDEEKKRLCVLSIEIGTIFIEVIKESLSAGGEEIPF